MGEQHPMRLIRWRQGLTITRLAREAGVSRQTIYAIENGTRSGSGVGSETLRRLARALDVDPRELLEPEYAEKAG